MCNIRYQICVQALKVELNSKWLPLRFFARQPSCYYRLSEINNHGAEVSSIGVRFTPAFMKSGQMVQRLKCEWTERNTQIDKQTAWGICKPPFSRVFFVCVYVCLFHLFKQLTVVQEACNGDHTTADDPTLY